MENFRSFLCGQAAKKPKLDYLSLSFVQARQRGQGVIESDDIRTRQIRNHNVLEGEPARSAASLLIEPGSGEIDQDAAHDARGYAEEVGSILPLRVPGFCEPQKGFVYKGSGLEGMTVTLTTHICVSEPVKFRVDEGYELFQRAFVALAPGSKECSHFWRGWQAHIAKRSLHEITETCRSPASFNGNPHFLHANHYRQLRGSR